jgi:CheY-like chemotaxis protein
MSWMAADLEPSSQNSKPPSVLLVDDNEDARKLMRACATHLGLRPLEAESAQSAWEILGKESVDLLVTDVEMPGDNGLSLLARVRELHAQLPVLVVTAESPPPPAFLDFMNAQFLEKDPDFLVKLEIYLRRVFPEADRGHIH